MPPIRASLAPDMRGWQSLAPGSPAGEQRGTVPPPPPPLARSPFMHASMPLMASTADAFARQFYSQGNLPQTRILPTRKGGQT